MSQKTALQINLFLTLKPELELSYKYVKNPLQIHIVQHEYNFQISIISRGALSRSRRVLCYPALAGAGWIFV